MKKLIVLSVLILFFSGCFNNESSLSSKKECIKQGFKFETKKIFNFRDGKYELKTLCHKK